MEHEREWRQYLIARLDKMENKIEAITNCQAEIKEKIVIRLTKLEIKAGLWGALGGFFVSLVALFKAIV